MTSSSPAFSDPQPSAAGSPPAVARRSTRQRIVVVPLVFGTLLLIYNQRIGWDDGSGPNWLAFALRSDIWFVLTLLAAGLMLSRWMLWPRTGLRVARFALLQAPAVFVGCFLFATLLTRLRHGLAPDVFGMFDFGKTLMITALGILTFNLARANREVASTLIQVLTWTPAINIVLGLIMLLTSLDPGVMDPAGSGRFVGTASNPNIAMTQSAIALGLLMPRLLQGSSRRSTERAVLLLYAISLVGIIAWTGVRAALVVLPMLATFAVWYRSRATPKGLATSVVRMVQVVGLFVIAGAAAMKLGLSDVLFDRLESSEDGRLFLWILYSQMLVSNPLGLGMAFETVADTTSIVEGQRLPPHNALLLAGMYAGGGGVVVTLVLLFRVFRFALTLRRAAFPARVPVQAQGLVVGWFGLVLNLMFGGLFQLDPGFVILTALLFAAGERVLSEFHSARQLQQTGVAAS